jgi:ectoine hydroxylase-related dioxygenase (phytanoyl-CoA dioxygenase family)
MILFKDKINYKLANGNGFHAHVDYHAYSHMGEISHITANVAVDEANIANGCLQVVPGSHKTNIEFSNGGRISSSWEDAHEWVYVPLGPGDVLLFGSQLAHRSEGNNTDKSRTSLYATYYMAKDGDDLRQKYYTHRRSVFPPDHGTCSPSLRLLFCFVLCGLLMRYREGRRKRLRAGLEDVWLCRAVLGNNHRGCRQVEPELCQY